MSQIAAPTRETIVAFLADIFERRGAVEYLGEPVTIAQHMLQAATIAEQNGQDEAVVVAALLHDIGHFTSELGCYTVEDTEDRLHDEAGAETLAPFFPPVVVDCVRHHVAAKRYLCATRQSYRARLSDASVHSLELQGGPMSEAEVEAFERLPHFKEIVQIRYLDEAAKRPDVETPPFAHFAPMVQRLVDAQMRTATT